MSTPEFTIPTKPEDLAHEDCIYEVRATNLKELKELSSDDTKTFAHGKQVFENRVVLVQSSKMKELDPGIHVQVSTCCFSTPKLPSVRAVLGRAYTE